MKKILLVITMMYFATLQASATSENVVCTMDYTPVCGSIQVQCVMAPCEPIRQTFGNSCMAHAANATHIVAGECGSTQTTGNKKVYARAALQDGSWMLESFNGKMIAESATLSFAKNSRFYAKVCNVMNGRYGVAIHRLNLREVMSTMMYCEGDLMAIENAMSTERLSFMVTPDVLTIMTQKGDTIVWKKAELTQ